jgi:hypothetical protein
MVVVIIVVVVRIRLIRSCKPKHTHTHTHTHKHVSGCRKAKDNALAVMHILAYAQILTIGWYKTYENDNVSAYAQILTIGWERSCSLPVHFVRLHHFDHVS